MFKPRIPDKSQEDAEKYQRQTKSQRLKESIQDIEKYLPDSYRTNNGKEELCLEYVELFRKQYVHLYDDRPPLMLFPKNELGCKKFISTYIRPTMLPFHELYDWKAVAKFVANYITYEPLENPTALPEVVVSPTTTLYWQKGDCFDMSILLASLLAGVGYNVYCVSGYAKKDVTMCNQRVNNLPEEIELEEPPPPPPIPKYRSKKYILKKRANLVSDFDKKKAQPKENDGQYDFSIPPFKEQDEYDELEGERVHCWVAVLVGARDVTEPFFIEPSTGEKVSLNDYNYISIESVWNHENYWVNMQNESRISDMIFDLSNLQHWEYIIIEEESDEEENTTKSKNMDLGIQTGEVDNQILDLPASWVDKIIVTQEQYESKYPGKQKQIRYKDALLELYAEYFMPDCLVKRITLYKDEEHKEIMEIHCYYEHRKDLLQRRSIYYIEDGGEKYERVHEWFAPGRRRGNYMEYLRETVCEIGRKREYRFYSEARLDGLDSRIELYDPKYEHPKKVIEKYKGRSDFLIYRCAIYDVDPSMGQEVLRKTPEGDSSPIEIQTMIEKFERNPSKDANHDVAKRVFKLTEGLITLEYHYGDDKITRSTKQYTKDGMYSAVIVDPFMKRPKWSESVAEFKQLLQAERECKRAITELTKEIKEIYSIRGEEELDVKSTTTIYNVARNKPTEEELRLQAEKEREAKARRENTDYLRRYLEGIKLDENGNVTNVEDAEKVWKLALDDLKKRLITRGRIIQDRLNQERNKLTRRMISYQKSQEQHDKTNDEYFEMFQESEFKIKILKERLENHKTESNRKYNELKLKMLQDPRLGHLLTHYKKMTGENIYKTDVQRNVQEKK